MDSLLPRHRKEWRELQDRITQKKKNATKKTRKGVNDECAELERQLEDQQRREVGALSPSQDLEDEEVEAPAVIDETSAVFNSLNGASRSSNIVNELSHQLNGTTLDATEFTPAQSRPKKPNRQKARLARRAAEQDALAAEAAAEAAMLPDQRAEERKVMERETAARGLQEREVRSDGHCLYAAVADQLSQQAIALEQGDLADYQAVRRDAAYFIETHPQDFDAFLEEPLDSYVRKIRDTAEWGGQLELSALARAYDVRIQVLQGNGRVETIESGKPEKEIWLAYYRHSFGLGEHYNSLRKKSVATGS